MSNFWIETNQYTLHCPVDLTSIEVNKCVNPQNNIPSKPEANLQVSRDVSITPLSSSLRLADEYVTMFRWMECNIWSGGQGDQAWWSTGWYWAYIFDCSWEGIVITLLLTEWVNHRWELSHWRFSWASWLEDQQSNLLTMGNLAQRGRYLQQLTRTDSFAAILCLSARISQPWEE